MSVVSAPDALHSTSVPHHHEVRATSRDPEPAEVHATRPAAMVNRSSPTDRRKSTLSFSAISRPGEAIGAMLQRLSARMQCPIPSAKKLLHPNALHPTRLRCPKHANVHASVQMHASNPHKCRYFPSAQHNLGPSSHTPKRSQIFWYLRFWVMKLRT